MVLVLRCMGSIACPVALPRSSLFLTRICEMANTGISSKGLLKLDVSLFAAFCIMDRAFGGSGSSTASFSLSTSPGFNPVSMRAPIRSFMFGTSRKWTGFVSVPPIPISLPYFCNLNSTDPDLPINLNQHFPRWNAVTFSPGAPTFAAVTCLRAASAMCLEKKKWNMLFPLSESMTPLPSASVRPKMGMLSFSSISTCDMGGYLLGFLPSPPSPSPSPSNFDDLPKPKNAPPRTPNRE
mmetsp:Transcript_4445/g.9611  ORF Transcript_4445/g.9611 Transcript_4445/m.9611 type:complete len:238 (-) Transcript_4445:268-981(-)